MNESFDDQIKKLKDLLDRNELLHAQSLLLLIEREFHLELMHNLQQQREHLLALNNLLEEQRWQEKERLRNSLGNN
jgi:hypothetical protein